MAFVRETEGRGSLWVMDPGPPSAKTLGPGTERNIVDATYDVSEAAFLPRNRVIFSAQPQGVPRLFVVDLDSRLISPLDTQPRRARYPAVSTDGRWLAFSEEENGALHLRLRDMTSGKERLLTGGDCNSVTPAWLPDSKNLIYATDCGRGLGLTALCQLRAAP